MLVDHHHEPGVFDAGRCWACARQAGPLDHYERVQREEARLQQARQRAGIALWSAGAVLLLAATTLLAR